MDEIFTSRLMPGPGVRGSQRSGVTGLMGRLQVEGDISSFQAFQNHPQMPFGESVRGHDGVR